MVKRVRSIEDVPETHKTQLSRHSRHFPYKCPVTGLSRTSIMKVLDTVPGCDGYILDGELRSDVRYMPEQIKNNMPEANRIYARKHPKRHVARSKIISNHRSNTWENLQAARELYMEALQAHYHAIKGA